MNDAPARTLLLGVPDATFARDLGRALGRAWRVVPAPTADDARAALRAGPAPDLLLLDCDAFGDRAARALCRELRLAEARAGTPRARVEFRMRECAPRAVRAALAAGADDCRAPVPAATLAALLASRTAGAPAPGAGEEAPDSVRVDPLTGGVLLAGRPLPLTGSEAAALRVLVAWNGEARTRAQLLRDLRGDDAGFVQPRAVDSLVADLRAKLGPAGWRLRTAWGIGYRWDASPANPGTGGGAPGGRARRRYPLAAAGTLGLLLLAAAAHHALFHVPPAPTSSPPSEREDAAQRPGAALRAETRETPPSGSEDAAQGGALRAAPAPDPAVLALRAAFALPADTPPAVGIAVPPASDLLTSSAPPPDDYRL